MALDQSALMELLEALRAGGSIDVMREALAFILQALIDAEATSVTGKTLEPIQERRAKLLRTRERELHLGLNARRSRDATS